MVEISMMEIAIGVGGLVVGFALGRMTGINNTGNRHHVDNRGATQGSTITDNRGAIQDSTNVQTAKGKQNN